MRLIPAFASTFGLVVLSSATLAQGAGTAGTKKSVERPQAAARPASASIDPGMTKAQVVERFGKASSEHMRGEFAYLFYSNGMEKQVGMSDVVILQGDHVVDAVLRSPRRAYSGTSSSPHAISAKDAAHGKPSTLKVGGHGH